MSRIVVRYVDGKPEWRDLGPGYCRPAHLGGEIVRGDHGAVEQQRLAERAFKARQRAEK